MTIKPKRNSNDKVEGNSGNKAESFGFYEQSVVFKKKKI